MMGYFGIILSIRIYRVQQVKNEQLVNNFNDGLIDLGSTIDLRSTIIRKKITQNENPNKIVNIVEKILNFNKQQKGKGNINSETNISKITSSTCRSKSMKYF